MAFGAGIYEYRIVMPMWFGVSRIDRASIVKTDVGRRFWGVVTTIPLTLLTFANLYLSFRSKSGLHTWWTSACIIILAERMATFGYFIPTIIKLANPEKLTDHQALAKASQWKQLNMVRILLNLAGLIAAAMAYTFLARSME